LIELAQISLIISTFITFSVYCSKSVSLRVFDSYGMKVAVNLQVIYVFIYSFIYNFLLLLLYFYIIKYESIIFKFLFIFFVIVTNIAIILSDSKNSIVENFYKRYLLDRNNKKQEKDE
jgi:hypothetical protein